MERLSSRNFYTLADFSNFNTIFNSTKLSYIILVILRAVFYKQKEIYHKKQQI